MIARDPTFPLTLKQATVVGLVQRSEWSEKLTEAILENAERHSFALGDRLMNAISTGEAPSLADVRTPAEARQIIELSKSRLQAVTLLVMATEGRGTSLPDETIRQLLLLEPSAAEEIVLVACFLVRQLNWTRARHLVLVVSRHAATSIELPTWATFLQYCLAGRLATEVLELFVELGLAERLAPLYEALHAVVDGNSARLDGLAPEMRFVARTIFDHLRPPEPSQCGGGAGGPLIGLRSETRKPARRAASATQNQERSKPGKQPRAARRRRAHGANSAG